MTIKSILTGSNVPVLVWADDLDEGTQQQLLKVASMPFIHKHVAAMADSHLGKGSTIGSVIATRKAIIPAAVGVDLGCFVGRTKIETTNGKMDIQSMVGASEPYHVFAKNPSNGEVVSVPATAILTRKDASLAEVVLSNGAIEYCTPDHQFLTLNEGYVEAQYLRERQELSSLRPVMVRILDITQGVANPDMIKMTVCPFEGGTQSYIEFTKLHIFRVANKEFDSFKAVTVNDLRIGNFIKFQEHVQVVSVSKINMVEDVYCLQVPGFNNFALASGVFVHNCGMLAAQTSLTANDLTEVNLKATFAQISRDVPVGNSQHNDDRVSIDRVDPFVTGLSIIQNKHPDILKQSKNSKWMNQMGTLGGGNHFIELCLDEVNNVWIMLHSGSRGIGNQLASYFIAKARSDMEKWMINLPDRDLAYIPEGAEYFDDYVQAVHWSQDYAHVNREYMFELIVAAMVRTLPPFSIVNTVINCHHNYIAIENHYGENVYVTRKGAIRARLGEVGIIPGSMGTKSYIVHGRGNPESFHSCSHGAGRRMSRTAARTKYSVDDMVKATEGVVCRKDADVIDEIPYAYKNIDTVMENQSDLVTPIVTLKQVLCIKG